MNYERFFLFRLCFPLLFFCHLAAGGPPLSEYFYPVLCICPDEQNNPAAWIQLDAKTVCATNSASALLIAKDQLESSQALYNEPCREICQQVNLKGEVLLGNHVLRGKCVR